MSDFERLGTAFLSCEILVLRSCFELESDALHILSKVHQKPIIPLGLLPPSLPSNEDKGDGNWEAVKKWLDSKQEKSVFMLHLVGRWV